MSFRSRSNRVVVFLAGFAVQGVLNLGAPAVAHAQTPPGISSSARPRVAHHQKAGGNGTRCCSRPSSEPQPEPRRDAHWAAAAQSSETMSCGLLAAPYALLGAAIGVVPGMIAERRNERDPLSFDEVRRRVKAEPTSSSLIRVDARPSGRSWSHGRLSHDAGDGWHHYDAGWSDINLASHVRQPQEWHADRGCLRCCGCRCELQGRGERCRCDHRGSDLVAHLHAGRSRVQT